MNKFLLTRLCEARLLFFDICKDLIVFLLTRLCEARHVAGQKKETVYCISTHAPLRGATPDADAIAAVIFHFYSRASARRDIQMMYGMMRHTNFYSRASARRDNDDETSLLQLIISTHAPLRGATQTSCRIAPIR